MVGHALSNVLIKQQSSSPSDVPPGGHEPVVDRDRLRRWICGGGSCAAGGRVIGRRLQALLPPDPPTAENASQPARAAPARAVIPSCRHLSGSSGATAGNGPPGGL